MKHNRILTGALALALALGLSAPALAAGPTFSDVPETHWAYPYIEQAAADGIVSGVGNNKYNPSGTVSYAEFGTMVARSFRESIVETNLESYNNRNKEWYLSSSLRRFTDDDKWWAPYMEAMETAMLLDDTAVFNSGTYRNKWDIGIMESGISRYDMAMIIYNLMNASYDPLPKPSDSEIEEAKDDISDWDSIPEKYQDAVAACYAGGYLSGVDDTGRFNGSSTMDRAQAATVMCRMTGADVGGTTTTPDDGDNDDTQTGTAAGEKDAQGHTTANSVNSVRDRGKSDEYPTTGNSDKVSVNGYYTGSTVDVGGAVLVYDFLDWVNEERRAAGLNELEWVQSDAAEEYTLVRADDLMKDFSHFGQHAGFATEVIASGAMSSTEDIFQMWMESDGHRDTLLYPSDSYKYMCAAKAGSYWVITMWRDFSITNVENNSDDYIVPVR